MLKSNIDVFVTSFLCSLKFVLFHRIEYPKRCLWKQIEIFLFISFCDVTVPSKRNVPSCDLGNRSLHSSVTSQPKLSNMSELHSLTIEFF